MKIEEHGQRKDINQDVGQIRMYGVTEKETELHGNPGEGDLLGW
jgi:hypothetical protein